MHLRSFSSYFVFNVLSAMLPIVTLPLFTRYLTPADYGVLAIFNIIAMFAGNFFRLELNSALKREYVHDFNTFSRYVSTAFLFSHFLLLFCALVLLLLTPWLHAFHGIAVQWYFAVLLLAYLRFHTVCLHHLFQISNRAILYGIWGLAATVATFGLAIWLMISLGWGWEARAGAEVFVGVVALPVAVYFLRRDYALQLHFDAGSLKKMLRFSAPLLMSSMLGYVMISSDRFFIAEMVGPQELGLYTVAIQLSSATGMFLGAITPIWESWIYASQGGVYRENVGRVFRRFFALVSALVLLATLLPSLLDLVLPYLTAKNFYGTGAYLAPTVAAATSAGVFGLLSPILIFMRKTPVVASINVLMVLINFGCLYVFIEIWGAVGAAYAMTLSYAIGSALMLFFVIRFSDAKFEDVFTVR